jgi:hypothetical protein
MKPLAWVLVVVIPWTAFVTVFLALRRGRPRPYAGWSSERIQHRLDELDDGRELDAAGRSERRQLWEELFRRGRGHEGEVQPGSTDG